ncbi:ABC-2 type transporter-domain-containing protein [Microdochium bolleyi]|uniref:ABC-2 type transporter-domain-containing protein n=1 Tax=Microdochium bolleyi TaxID=196109 RepID=A0A136IYI9_9PEZI|nr:ABC-2 type transporter-domain-containing protein [Microdochium bolleyi]
MADHRDPEKAQEGISAPADSAQIAAEHKQISDKAPIEPPSSSSGSDATISPEEERERARKANPNGFANAQGGVNIDRATADFAELQRSISGHSRISRIQSRQSQRGGADVEKVKSSRTGGEESDSTEELFDLEATLRGGLAAEQEAGIKPKHIGVYWNDLTVKGMGGFSNYVQTFPDAFKNFFDIWSPLRNLVGKGPAFTEATLLDNFKGVVKPGEMVLVLGRPGSGCTTFLKNIANQRAGYTGVSGEVLYGPWTADEFKQYRGEAVYNQEDDIHHSTLSVGQTLGFALDVKVPNKLPAGTTKGQFKEDVISMLLKMFNIEHTRNTVVGDAIVRGVSGGERKRVSIAEMMITNACILSWDNSTRGLDASTALDFAKSLRIQTNLYQTSTFVSLYQASENIYKQFDKVLVIDSGKQVYFGPASEARAYFEGLGFLPRPRQTTPDYVTGCTDEFERDYADGYSPENAPHSAETLAEAFDKSTVAARLREEMAEYKTQLEHESSKHDDFQTAVRESKRGGAKHSVYGVGFHLQVWAIMKRQFVLKMQDKLSLFLSWLRAIVIAIVLGTLYLNLGQTSASAFSKGGLLFISLLFNAFQAFSELGSTMTGRPIVNKHKAYAFHRPSALWIAQIFVDTAFSAVQIMVFSIIVYFMTNLTRTAGAFFTYYLLILVGNIAMTLFFRIIGCVSPDFDYAIKFAVVSITLLILTSGYLIQYQNQQVWLRWIFWINPLGLAFAALMANEFGRSTLTCSSESLVPTGPGYDNVNNQVCTLAGSTPGTLEIDGGAYITQAFQYAPQDLWRNFGIIMAIIVFFLAMNVLLGEFVKFGAGGSTFRTYAKPTEELEKLNADLQSSRLQRQKSRREGKDETSSINSVSVLTWEDLNYDVPVPGGTRRLLNSVYGYCKPGQLTALMGASGAGKTTLLDVLAARKNIGVIAGDILVDGVKPGKEFQRSTSYAEQQDLHDPTQTVREALRFSADLRQPMTTSQEEKYAYVEEIIALLEMEDIADAIIGYPEFGLVVEQRKRLTIGVELAAKPELLLFLDEPTSGLDSQSAFNIVRFLKKLAGAGQAILCTIHQPNAALFENFDRLLLLQRGGQCVYFGDIGTDAHVLRDYLARHGAVAGESENIAEFMLEAIGAGSRPRYGDRDWADIWADSPELANVKDTISQLKEQRMAAATEIDPALQREFASPKSHQLKTVMRRMNVSLWRSPNYLFTRVFNHVIIALFTGLTYLQLDNSRASLQNKVFVMFQITVLPALVMSQAEVMWIIKRAIFFREQSSKMYSTFTFTTTMIVAEIPYSILCAVIFFLPIYYMPGFQYESSRAGLQFFFMLLTELFSITLGQVLAAISPSAFIACQYDPFIVITFALFCGVTIPYPQMPGFWKAWLYQLDPFTRLIGGTVTTALEGVEVVCKSSELQRFNAPGGSSCGEYMAPYFKSGGLGYIANNATSACEFCAYKVGNQFYEPLGFHFDNRWRDLGIYAAFIFSNIVILFLAGRFLNFNRR